MCAGYFKVGRVFLSQMERHFIDDILVYGKNKAEHDKRILNTLETLNFDNILLNRDKYILKVTKITFLGHSLSPVGLRQEHYIHRYFKHFRTPSTIDEVHSFLGGINFIGK